MELKFYTVEQLAEILRKHSLWLADADVEGGERANLYGANLLQTNELQILRGDLCK